MIELRAPSVLWHREWLDFLGRYGTDGHIPGAYAFGVDLHRLADPQVFQDWVQRLLAAEAGVGVPDGWVPASSRWVVRYGEIVGVTSLRHELNDHLLKVEGGHIGYAVAPDARGQGVAGEALRLTLAEAARMGINPVLVTCDETNLASARVIERASHGRTTSTASAWGRWGPAAPARNGAPGSLSPAATTSSWARSASTVRPIRLTGISVWRSVSDSSSRLAVSA